MRNPRLGKNKLPVRKHRDLHQLPSRTQHIRILQHPNSLLLRRRQSSLRVRRLSLRLPDSGTIPRLCTASRFLERLISVAADLHIRHNEGKALQKCRFCTVSTSVVVRLLSARCPVVVQSLTGQQLDNNWTTTGQRLDNERRRSCNLLAMNARFSGENWVPRTHRAPETDYMFGFTVRHTPPQRIYVWVHGATQPTQWIYVWVYSATHPALRAPLSERGWRGSDLLIIKTMRQPIPSRRGVAVGRGVSHHQTPTIPGVSHCQIGYPSTPVNPWLIV